VRPAEPTARDATHRAPQPLPPGLRVLLVDQHARMWGAQAVLLHVARVLVDAGCTVAILAPPGADLERRVREDFGGRVAFHPLRPPGLATGPKGPRDVLRMLRYAVGFGRYLSLLRRVDVIHVNAPRLYLPVAAWSLLGRRGQRYLYHVHLDHSSLEKRLVRLLLRTPTTAGVLVASAFLRRRLEAFDRLFAEDPRVALLENSLGTEAVVPSRHRLADRPLREALVLGRISRNKGQDLVVQAAASLPEIRFHVVGEADEAEHAFEKELRRRAPANVVFHGWQSDVASLIERHAIQASIVPSRWEEPFGMVAIETMAAGCLTLVRDRGGLAEIARRTGSPTFTSAQDLAETLRKLEALEPAERVRLAATQQQSVHRHYGIARFRREVLALYARPSAR